MHLSCGQWGLREQTRTDYRRGKALGGVGSRVESRRWPRLGSSREGSDEVKFRICLQGRPGRTLALTRRT